MHYLNSFALFSVPGLEFGVCLNNGCYDDGLCGSSYTLTHYVRSGAPFTDSAVTRLDSQLIYLSEATPIF